MPCSTYPGKLPGTLEICVQNCSLWASMSEATLCFPVRLFRVSYERSVRWCLIIYIPLTSCRGWWASQSCCRPSSCCVWGSRPPWSLWWTTCAWTLCYACWRLLTSLPRWTPSKRWEVRGYTVRGKTGSLCQIQQGQIKLVSLSLLLCDCPCGCFLL